MEKSVFGMEVNMEISPTILRINSSNLDYFNFFNFQIILYQIQIFNFFKNFEQLYLTHIWDPNRYYHPRSEWTWE